MALLALCPSDQSGDLRGDVSGGIWNYILNPYA